MHNVLIVGGGFGGIKAAQALSRNPGFSVRLVDPKTYMEYHAAVYRLVTGRSATETCIPYSELLSGRKVELVKDSITGIDLAAKTATGESTSRYQYDSLILAVGSETSYFGIKGVEEHSFGIKTIDEALRLKRHVNEIFETVKTVKPEDKAPALHIAVIGGGASGVELAGELASYTRKLAKKHGVDPSLITIDIIEAMPRLLPQLPERVSAKTLARLRSLGVNVLLNRSVVREETDQLFLKDMQMTAKTIVWTAGMKANRLASMVPGLPVDKRGRAMVNEYMAVPGVSDAYVIGDAAATKYSGMAQTALSDASYVARFIAAKLEGKTLAPYVQPAPAYSVPVGPRWAATVYHGVQFFGFVGWFMRRAADFRAFASLLPPRAAFRAYLGGNTVIDT